MAIFLFCLAAFALAMAGLALGVLAGRPPALRACGAQPGDPHCPDCGCGAAPPPDGGGAKRGEGRGP